MIAIRSEQLSEMQSAVDRRYAKTLVRIIANDYPHRTDVLHRAALEEDVVALVGKSHRYGFFSKREVRGFVCMGLFVGACFDEFPAIRDILCSERIPISDRMQLLIFDVGAKVWTDAKRWAAARRKET